ncbi:MAG: hypothetical protein EAY75_12975, partial [Bacteroidetes bacterium]
THLVDATSKAIVTIALANSDRWQMVTPSRFWPSYFVGTTSSLLRVFPYVRHYPKLYKNAHTLATHSLMQTDDGTIIAGNYSGDISFIRNNIAHPVPESNFPVLPGGCGIGNAYYYFAEGTSALAKGAPGKKPVLLKPPITASGFFVRPSLDGTKVLAGLSSYGGIGILSLKDAEAGRANWQLIDSTKGVKLVNVLTIAEDPRGRLWFGRSSEGWGVYDTALGRAVTYRIADGQTSFGAVSSAVDNQGFVWLAGRHGLWFANGNSAATPTPRDVKRLEHPLLPLGTDISAMRLWDSYLIIGAGKRVLLLNLDHFHQHKKDIQLGNTTPIIKYLNPHELDLTAEVDQNCVLVDKRDSSLWIGTNNQVYQVDVKTWLQLPFYPAKASIQVTAGSDTFLLNPNESLSLKPTSNSLQINVLYQTPDNMPRLIQKALLAEGDSIRWFGPDTDHQLVALNRQSGKYTFHLRILQSDGTITTHTFPITIRRFLWQQWWFWLLISGVVIGVTVYLFFLHKQKQLAEANAARIAAEADAFRSQQQRKLTGMQVKSLSTQFRPHFILNALNTIGAQLYDKPEVDAVLGQLGDSIGIIFRSAQAGSIAHPLAQEWRLVQSVCSIKQMELRHSIQIHDDVPAELPAMENFLVPMGILQIPVENALVHGLRNKEEGPKDLWISIQQQSDERIIFTITDNGIGRKAAALISNYRGNGVGTKNLLAIIELLNKHNNHPIEYLIHDDVIEEDGKRLGTQVTISIPQNFQYDI